jgi:hypothetical protein
MLGQLAEAKLKRLREQQAAKSTERPTFEEACRGFPIKTKDRGIVFFAPEIWHEEQRRFNAERTGMDIVVKPRQIGFSTLEVLRGYFLSSTREAFNTQIVIHDHTLAEGVFDMVRVIYDRTGSDREVGADRARFLQFSDTHSWISVTEAGHSIRTAQKKGRSGTIQRVHATEVAFWSHPEETLAGFIGAMPNGGEMLIESTPNGSSGWFYERVQEARRGEGPYKLHFFPWWQHQAYRLNPQPGFDPKPRDEWESRLRALGADDAQLAWWRSKVSTMTLEVALREFPLDIDTCFRSTGSEWLSQARLDEIATSVRKPTRLHRLVWKDGAHLGDLRVYAEPQQLHEYIVGADPAEGEGGDSSAVTVIDRRTAETVASFHVDNIEPGIFARALVLIGKLYRDALIAVERQNHGHAVLSTLRLYEQYPRVYSARDGKPGWSTTPVTRPVLFDDAYRAIEDGALTTPDAATYAEMKALVRGPTGKVEARHGAHDDLFVSLAIALQARASAGATDTPVRVGGKRATAGIRSAW